MLRIDFKKLIEELISTGIEMFLTNNKNIIVNNYNQYIILNEVLFMNFGKAVINNYDFSYFDNLLDEKHEKSVGKFINYLNESNDILMGISDNFIKTIDSIDFQLVPFWNIFRRYNEKDFKDVILGYFSTFGNDIYKIAKSYFDENRIHLGIVDYENYAGFYTGIPHTKTGYVFSTYEKYDSLNASIIAHELGHAVDAHRFIFPQQKNTFLFADCLGEVPSSTFEFGFVDYLKDNYIDIKGSSILENSKIFSLKDYMEKINETAKMNDVFVFPDGKAYGNEKQVFNLRDSILYGLGYYFALHLNLVKKSSTKEFLDRLNTLITSRYELSLENMIEKIGFNVDDFISGKYINDKISNDYMELRKRYKF